MVLCILSIITKQIYFYLIIDFRNRWNQRAISQKLCQVTSWVEFRKTYIVLQIILLIPHLWCSLLIFDFVGVEQLNNMQSPRLVKTHLPVELLPSSFWKNDCKVANFKEKDPLCDNFFYCLCRNTLWRMATLR